MGAMQIGLVGSGNMARAMARGWSMPVLCTDVVTDRAQALAAETGGEAVASNAELAQRADVVVICHKPAQLTEVATEVAPHAKAVASILGGVPLDAIRGAYNGVPVQRFMPSTPVELGQGAVIEAAEGDANAEISGLFARLGKLVTLPEAQIDVAMGLMSNAPAYWAVVVEAQVDAGVRRGLSPDVAADLVLTTMTGTGALIAARGGDTLSVRREVTSPGGSTARGLDALEKAGIRKAFSDALNAVLDGGR
jgi:pyrroline-5-carboxylate reductase